MKSARPIRLRQVVWISVSLILLHWLCAEVLVRVPLLEHLLSPGSDSLDALLMLGVFFALRAAVFLFLPAWIVVSLWFWWTQRSAPIRSSPPHPPATPAGRGR
ncbi:MAG: hypothetical protein JSS11_13390 [Verrucomicrobia bacterium]|nr:hypothetical protein [Verrucomicrobiota bacterium]